MNSIWYVSSEINTFQTNWNYNDKILKIIKAIIDVQCNCSEASEEQTQNFNSYCNT